MFQRSPERVHNFGDARVRIWSEEHCAYWRLLTGADGQIRGGGYVLSKATAGTLSLADAYRITRHCDPEKNIWFEFVPARETIGAAKGPAGRCDAEIAIRAERDIEIAGFLDGYARLVRQQRSDACAAPLANAVEGLASSLRAGLVD